MSAEEITIYWGIYSIDENNFNLNLGWEPPKPLISILPHAKTSNPGNYRNCTASVPMFRSIYAIINSIDAKVQLTGDVNEPQLYATSTAWALRESGFMNRYSVDYNQQWLFFSEESVKLQITPPYLHNTSVNSTATIASGAFDISKWFRPINPCFLLWDNQDSITLTKNEPLMYLQFMTDKKIKLVHFNVTKEMIDVAAEMVLHKNYFPFESLQNLYIKFKRGNFDKKILKLIKENILE